MDKKNEESLQSLSPYFSPLFLSAFSAYSSRFKKERTRREYLYAIASLCNSAGCSFFELRPEHILEYFQSSDLKSQGSANDAASSKPAEPSVPSPPKKHPFTTISGYTGPLHAFWTSTPNSTA